MKRGRNVKRAALGVATLGFVALISGVTAAAAGRSGARGSKGLVLKARVVHRMRAFSGLTEQKEKKVFTLGAGGVKVETEGSRVVDLFRYDNPKGTKGTRRDIWYFMNVKNRTYERRDLAKRRAEDAEIERRMAEARKRRAGGGGSGRGGLFGALGQVASQGSAAPEGDVEVERTGKKVSIAGYPCEHVVFKQGGQVVCEVWVATRLKKGGSVKHLASAKKLLLENSEGKNNRKLLAARLALEGVELKSKLVRVAGQHYTIEVTGVSEKTLPASTFHPPPGFKQVDKVRLFGPGN